MNTTLNYVGTFKKHSLIVLAGISKEWGINNWITASRQNIISEGVEVVSGGTENIENSASGVEWTMLSYFGRLNYNFTEKYLFEANIRRDGTSRFQKTTAGGPSLRFRSVGNSVKKDLCSLPSLILQWGKYVRHGVSLVIKMWVAIILTSHLLPWLITAILLAATKWWEYINLQFVIPVLNGKHWKC